MKRSDSGLPITHLASLITLLLLLGGCGGTYQTFYSDPGPFDANYATFEHPFTEAGEVDAKRRADAQCGQKKRVAVVTSRACSLERCTTSFQCISPTEPDANRPGAQKK